MTAKEKAYIVVDRFNYISMRISDEHVKECAMVSIYFEYNSLRQQLINLRETRVIENETTYLFRMQELIDEEKEIMKEIQNFKF